jgi:serine/threonine protein kinase
LLELIAKALKASGGTAAFTSNQAAGVASGVMQGLAYMHGRHIVHRDIKPANILVNYAGDVKVRRFDFVIILLCIRF